jgi:hypothetical protein
VNWVVEVVEKLSVSLVRGVEQEDDNGISLVEIARDAALQTS